MAEKSSQKEEDTFKKQLRTSHSKDAAEEILKWYNPSIKK
jgi:hypothetical protein